MPLSPTTRLIDYLRLTPIQKTALKKLGASTILDLVYHFPVRYGDTAEARSIETLKHGDTAVVYGRIGGLKTGKGWKSHIAMADGYVEDETGHIPCVWFNQPYVAKMFTDGMLVRIEGKVSEKRAKAPKASPAELPVTIVPESNPHSLPPNTRPSLYFSNPKIERVDKLPTGVGDSLFGDQSEAHTLYPVYPESRGISSLWLYHTIQKIFKNGLLDTLPEPIPAEILEKYHLPSLKTALIWMHAPLTRDDALAARKRFAFEEVFLIQLGKRQARKEYEAHPTYTFEPNTSHVREFVKRFPFTATAGQNTAIETILADFNRGYAMTRLLEGDVGSGKTAVAAATAYAVIANRNATTSPTKPSSAPSTPLRLQVAYMCPTEILATQHFESFISYFAYLGVEIALITGSGCRKFPSKVNPKGWTDISRSQLLKWVASGQISVVIGTHALIQKSVVFRHLAYVIIDEQHRFGTAQRSTLVKKDGLAPHFLSMTATPIPRTLALTMYGDLDLTVLDQSPSGRKPIITELVLPNDRTATYEKIRQELHAGRQAYVICPRIDAPDPDKEAALLAKSVKEESVRLRQSVFPEYQIGILHGKMTPAEKDRVMNEFKDGRIRILCATSVVEVGVNVPNATVIVIEGAERFGLAQLHQLRGRVMRSSLQAYCYAFTETSSAKSIARLKALQTAKNGFELAELDLSQRGAGNLSGLQQWGISDVGMEALQNQKMVEAARAEAMRLVDNDPTLSEYPLLAAEVARYKRTAHFE